MLRSQLARKYETEHWSRFSKIINWSADSFQINHVTSMSWHMSPRYGHGILVCGYPVLTAVNWPLWMSNVKDVDLARHAWDTPPFLLIVSPTPPVQSLDAYVRSVNHVTTKRKEVDHNLWVWGSVPRALRVPLTRRQYKLKSENASSRAKFLNVKGIWCLLNNN